MVLPMWARIVLAALGIGLLGLMHYYRGSTPQEVVADQFIEGVVESASGYDISKDSDAIDSVVDDIKKAI